MMARYGRALEEESHNYNIPVDALDIEPVYEDIEIVRGREESRPSGRGTGVSSLFCWRVASATRVLDF